MSAPAPSVLPPVDPKEAITFFRPQDDREDDRAPLNFALIRRLFHYTDRYRARRNWLFVIVLLRGLQLPALAWAIGAVIEGPISDRDPGGILAWTLGYLVLAVTTSYTFHHRQRLALLLGESVVHDLRAELFRKLLAQPMGFYDKTKFGRIISRLVSDIESVRAGVQDVAFVSSVQLIQALGAAALMCWYNWLLFCVLLLIVPAVYLVDQRFRRDMSRQQRALQESWSRVSSTLGESISGIRVTQAFVRQDTNAGFFRRLVQSHAGYNLGVARTSAVFVPLLQLKSQLFLGVMLLMGGYGVLAWTGWARMEVGDLVIFFFLANLFFEPVTVLAGQYQTAMTAMAGGERLFRLLDAPPEWQDDPGATDLARIEGRVEFERVTFGYDPRRPVLHEVSFVAEPGQTIALVGHTGSGKTTIASLTAKFYLPSAGRVLIDGRDLATITSRSLHSQMGSVQQNNFLFSGTVLDNIRFARLDATEDDVRRVLRDLDCSDLIEALPRGLATVVGERGAGLSLGQRQLICFARALLADPRILILDEATSAVDTETEARLQRALEVLLRGRTSFIVAHRLSTIRQADLVLVLEQGRIVERGTHDALVAAGGVYARLHAEFTRAAERA